ncbi:hypothetical protein GCM10010191_45420 [Actinomadura vinacea]|uniref:Uncharacterized protein n=1 Tax=Actinomadura vinacea TaxID=115336 RepID=A0ABP5WHA4_9ACTN
MRPAVRPNPPAATNPEWHWGGELVPLTPAELRLPLGETVAESAAPCECAPWAPAWPGPTARSSARLRGDACYAARRTQ